MDTCFFSPPPVRYWFPGEGKGVEGGGCVKERGEGSYQSGEINKLFSFFLSSFLHLPSFPAVLSFTECFLLSSSLCSFLRQLLLQFPSFSFPFRARFFLASLVFLHLSLYCSLLQFSLHFFSFYFSLQVFLLLSFPPPSSSFSFPFYSLLSISFSSFPLFPPISFLNFFFHFRSFCSSVFPSYSVFLQFSSSPLPHAVFPSISFIFPLHIYPTLHPSSDFPPPSGPRVSSLDSPFPGPSPLPQTPRGAPGVPAKALRSVYSGPLKDDNYVFLRLI